MTRPAHSHWDLDGKSDDKSSAWLRVAQSWAGTSFGAQFIPRIGMEVLVGFLDGNADHPVVMACLYNGTHPTPFGLPADGLKSGFRTQSSPGEGNSELSFHDKAGAEKVLLVAQRDLEEVVNHDHSLNVTGQQSIVVGGSRKDTVAGNSTVLTTGDLHSITLASRTDQIMNIHKEEIGGGRLSTVHGSETVTIKGNSIKTVEQEANQRTLGNLTMEIGTHDKPGTADVYSWGDYALGSFGSVRIRAQDGLVLVCGDSRLEITQKGITLKGQTVSLSGKSVSAQGDGPALRLEKEAELVADKIRLYAKKSSLELDENAHLDGTQVLLNCGPQDPSEAVDDDGKPTTQHLSIKLTDPMMKPYAGKDFILKAGGMKIEGTTDGDGKVTADVPKAAQTAEISLWLEARPTGKTKRYVVKLGELPPIGTIPGIEARLRNLGYYWGSPATTLTATLGKSLKDFQIDHDLDPTGKPDGATAAKLAEVHGH